MKGFVHVYCGRLVMDGGKGRRRDIVGGGVMFISYLEIPITSLGH